MSSPSQAVNILSQGEILARLAHLRDCFDTLPTTLSDTTYSFQQFELSDEDIEDRGRVGALNHHLECTFCPQGRVNGPFLLNGRGPGLLSLVDVLSAFILDFPGDAILQKWVEDLIGAAEHTSLGTTADSAGGSTVAGGAGGSTSKKRGRPSGTATEARGQPAKKAKSENQVPRTKEVDCPGTSVLSLYEDAQKPRPKGPGGRGVCPLLDKISIYCRRKRDGELIYRCVGASHGCVKTFPAARDKARVLRHAGGCQFLSDNLRQAASSLLAEDAPSRRARAAATSPASDEQSHTSKNTGAKDGAQSVASKPGTTDDASLFEKAKAKGRQQLQASLDAAIVKLVCVAGIPPRVADLPEWKEAWSLANAKYNPASKSKLENSQIPCEAAAVCEAQLEILRTKDNLTISFDGGSLKSTESNLTIHITTEDRQVYFFEGKDSTGFSHTGVYHYHALKNVIDLVGPKQFRGICSDNTSNTTTARDMIRREYPWIMILPDACHRLHRLCGDVCKLDRYKEPISIVRRTLKFMKKSGVARDHLQKKRLEMGISRGLVSIGKTRFASIYHSSSALVRCMPALRDLCGSGTIKIKDVNGVYLNGPSAWKFNAELQELVDVLAPMAKSITCLESTHSTVSDVYVFWLACMAGVYDVISTNNRNMSVSDKDTIREAAQARWLQMIENAPCDVYFAGFMLDPRFRNHDILNDLNPLTIKAIKIPSQNPNKSDHKFPKSVKRLGDFLLSLLRIEYNQKDSPIAGLTIAQALDNLKDQIPSYIKGSYPFELGLSPSADPFEWWKRLDEDSGRQEAVQPLARLARGIFAVTPNSMADERTQSTYTWLNSNLRNRQSVQTVTRMIQIRNWYLQERKATITRQPTVKFRDMGPILGIPPANDSGLGSKSKAGPVLSQSEGVIVDDDSEDEGEDGDIGDLLDSDSEAEGSEERPDDADSDSEDLDAVMYEDLEAAVERLNLESWMLKDYLSETSTRPETAVNGKGKGRGKPAAEGRATRELTEADWKM